MSPMFFILMRILYPFDKVARIRELMRALIRLTISWVSDPEDVESFAYWDEDRAWLEGHIAALEYAMRCLVWDRARQLLGLPHISHRRQRNPKIRQPKSMTQLFKRLDQLAHDHDNLDKLAARLARAMKREIDNNPLRLDAPHQATSPALRAVEANHRRLASLSAQNWGRWIARPCAQDGGGGAFARGPPPIPIPDITICPPRRRYLRERTLTSATSRNLRHISPAPLRPQKNRPKPKPMTTRAKTLRLKQAIKWLAPARRD